MKSKYKYLIVSVLVIVLILIHCYRTYNKLLAIHAFAPITLNGYVNSFQHSKMRMPNNVKELLEYIENEDAYLYENLEKVHSQLNLKVEEDTIYVYWFGADYIDEKMVKTRSYFDTNLFSLMFSRYDMVLGGSVIIHTCDIWSDQVRFYYRGDWHTNTSLALYLGRKLLPIIEKNPHVLYRNPFRKPTEDSILGLKKLLIHDSGYYAPNWEDSQYGRLLYQMKQKADKTFEINRINCGNFDIYHNMDNLSNEIELCLMNIKIDTIQGVFFSIRPYEIYDALYEDR
jgi:hypothetical protein